VRCRPEPDGMGSLWALLPAPDTALVNTVLDAAADGGVSNLLCKGCGLILVSG
jgi:hypothetical protein